MTKLVSLPLERIFYLESEKDYVACIALDEAGVLHRTALGRINFNFIRKLFPWTYVSDGKGCMINFDNIERINPMIVTKGGVAALLGDANDPESTLLDQYTVAYLRDFPNPRTDIENMKGGTTLIFKKACIHTFGRRNLALLTPIGFEIIGMMQERQMNGSHPDGLHVLIMPSGGNPNSTGIAKPAGPAG